MQICSTAAAHESTSAEDSRAGINVSDGAQSHALIP